MVKRLSHSLRSSFQDPSPPTLSPTQHVARLTASHGKSLFTVQLPSGEPLSASLHSKLKNALWIHRGTFVVVEVAEPGEAVIVGVLTREQIKEMKRMGEWPMEFVCEEEPRIVRGLVEGEDGGEDNDGLDRDGLEDDSIVDEDTKDTNDNKDTNDTKDTKDNEDVVN